MHLISYFSFGWRLESESDCTLCDPGKFCPSPNMSDASFPLDDCDAGYYCSEGSPTATPLNETYGDECPAGEY